MIVCALAYSIFQYDILNFSSLLRVDIVKRMKYRRVFLKWVVMIPVFLLVLFDLSFVLLPSFETLFIEAAVLRSYCSYAFNTTKTSQSSLRHVSRFQIPRFRRYYGDSMRRSFAGRVFNYLRNSCLNLRSKASLQNALRDTWC